MSVTQISNYNNEGIDVAKVTVPGTIDGVKYSTYTLSDKEYKIAAEIAKDEIKNLLSYHTDPFSISGQKNYIDYEYSYNYGKNKLLTMSYDDAADIRWYYLNIIRKKAARFRRREEVKWKIIYLYRKFIKLFKKDKEQVLKEVLDSTYSRIIKRNNFYESIQEDNKE